LGKCRSRKKCGQTHSDDPRACCRVGVAKDPVNAIAPGGVETEGTHSASIIGTDFEKAMITRTALGHIGQPDDIARVAVFLAAMTRDG
jgi:NAD(P)-dependent dehydrogenase (short-subunit alcohol dehydrogenase family)